MADQSQLKHHAGLLDRMATVLDIDLEDAALSGRLPVPDIAEAVLACTACSNPEFCARWLDDHAKGSDRTPGFCRNKDRLAGLRG